MSLWWLLLIVPACIIVGFVIGALVLNVLIAKAFLDAWK